MRCTWRKLMAGWSDDDPLWFRALDGVCLIGLLACFVAGSRLDAARATRLTLEQSVRVSEQAARAATGDGLAIAWVVVIAIGLPCAIWVAGRVYAITRDEGAVGERRLAQLKVASIAALACWLAWQVSGLLMLVDLVAPFTTAPFAAGSVLAALAALALAGRGVVGDTRHAWHRAAVVRIQLIVLGALFAAVFVIPFTSAQLLDVLRAWGEQPHSRAVAGIAGALLLGAVCRAGAVRILVPDKERLVIGALAAALIALPVIVILLYLRAWLMIAVVVAVVAIIKFTRRVGPRDPGGALAEDGDADRGVRQLAGTLGVVPLGTLLAGVVAATADSLLLPAAASGEDRMLIFWSAVVCALCGALAVVTHRRDGQAAARRQRLPGISPPIVVGACCTAMLGLGLLPDEWMRLVAGVILALLAAALAFAVLGEQGAPELWGALGAAIGMAIAIYAEPIDAPRAFGTIALAFVGCGGVLLVLGVAGSAGARLEPPPSLRILPSRVPVVTLLAVWLAAAWYCAPPEFHQVRTVPAGDEEPKALGTAVSAWLDRQWAAEMRERRSATGAERERIEWPMVLVGASGGGSKAAYWTDLVLDCALGRATTSGAAPYECPGSVLARARYRRLFLTSSVSGGSVGVRHFVEHRRRILGGADWIDSTAGPEVLSPVVAWGLFHDLPVFMSGMRTNPTECDSPGSCRREADRALVQEAAIAARGAIDPPGGDGLLAPSGEPPPPVTIFNGTLDGGGARVLISPLSLAPRRLIDHGCPALSGRGPAAGSIDAHDVLAPGEDVPRVTAAVLSARFPGVEPAGRLGEAELTGGGNACRPPPPAPLPPILVRDGGYMENSGLLTIAELLPDIARSVRRWRVDRERPQVRVKYLVVSIDDDPAVLDADPMLRTRPRDALGIGKQAGPDFVTQRTRDRLQSCRFKDVEYMRISPPPHVGAQAATGWELSRTVRREDLAEALRRDDTAAPRRIERLRDILDGTARIGACPAVG